MWRRVILFFYVLSFVIPPLALAEEVTSEKVSEHPGYASQQPVNSLLGLGAMSGKNPGQLDYAFVADGEKHFDQRVGQFDFRQYGEAESRFEIGKGLGVGMQATTGITLLGIDSGEKIYPHLGIEVFSGRFSVNSNSAREKYYEWLPMVSAGIQLAAGKCRLLPLARAGGGLGNLGKAGIFPALGSAIGVSSYLDCSGFDLSGELTHLNAAGKAINLAGADLSIRLNHEKIGIGLRGERTSEPDRLEQRVLLLFRSRIAELL